MHLKFSSHLQLDDEMANKSQSKRYLKIVDRRILLNHTLVVTICLLIFAECFVLVNVVAFNALTLWIWRPKPHHLLPHLNPDWFYLSGNGLPKLFWKSGR